MIRRGFFSVLFFLAFLTPAAFAAGEPLNEQIVLQEAELRLLLAERNLERAYETAKERMQLGYMADGMRIRQRYRKKLEPLLDSERRNRLAARARLEHFASTNTDPAYASDALLRLAALAMEDADEKHAKAMDRFYANLDEKDGDLGKPPEKDYGEALEVLRKLLIRFPSAPHRDVALYLTGYSYAEMGRELMAVKAFQSLLRQEDDSTLRSEVLVRVGDYFFERNRTREAVPYYRAAVDTEGAWKDRALYKWAWSLYKLNRYDEAIEAFTRLADLGEDRPDLQQEALRYLAISYVEGKGYANAVSHIASRGNRPYDGRLMEQIADVLYQSTDYPGAVSAYSRLLARNPTAERSIDVARRILLSLHQQYRLVEAVEARMDFVKLFSPGGDWYEANQGKPEVIEDAELWSERMLYEYATFHHYWALRNVVESRPKARQAYRMYLSRFPQKPRAIQMAFYLAEVFYDKGEHGKAIELYEKVALSAPDPATDIATRAAYNMVLSARELFRDDEGNLDLLLDASRKFADMRPSDERSPLVLYHAGRLLCDYDRFDECRDVMVRLIEVYPDAELSQDAIKTVIHEFAEQKRFGELAAWADRLLKRRRIQTQEFRSFVYDLVGGAMFRDALAKEGEGAVGEAAKNYLEVYRRYPQTTPGQTALYNAAHSLEKSRDFVGALRLYDKLLGKHPDAKFAGRAAFRKGRIFENAVNYARAISAYTFAVSNYPEAPEAKDALFNVGALHSLLGEHERSAQIFEKHYAQFGRDATQPTDTLLRAAVQWEMAGRTERAKRTFLAYSRGEVNAQTPYAVYRAGLLADGGERRRLLEDALEYFDEVTEEADVGVLGAIRFELTELDRKRYMAMRLPAKLDRAMPALNEKAEALKRLQEAYTWVVEAGDPSYAVAALYRIGEAYAAFADMLYNAPVPDELTGEEADFYRFELEDRALPIEDKALQAFKRAEERALKNGRETKWTALIRRSLHDEPSKVRILTDELEPIFVASAHGLEAPTELRLDDVQPAEGDTALRYDPEELSVAESRLRNLVDDVVRKQRIFFHNGKPYLDRMKARE